MFELVIACFIGILIGTTTGMVPGIHVNTAGAILFASSTFLLTFLSPEFLCVLMVAMSIAHALIEFVPIHMTVAFPMISGHVFTAMATFVIAPWQRIKRG